MLALLNYHMRDLEQVKYIAVKGVMIYGIRENNMD